MSDGLSLPLQTIDQTVSDTTKYGYREDGTPKGVGWLGEIPTKDKKSIMTELSIGVNIDGKETLIPSIVPTLSQSEIRHLQRTQEPTDAIVQKAVDFARKRIAEGKSPFAD